MAPFGSYMDHTWPVGNHLDQFDSSVGEWRRERDNFTSASDKLGNFCRLWAGAWCHKWANKSQTKVFLAESSVCLGCKMFSDLKGCNTYLQCNIPCFIVASWLFRDHFGTLWCGRFNSDLLVTNWWSIWHQLVAALWAFVNHWDCFMTSGQPDWEHFWAT